MVRWRPSSQDCIKLAVDSKVIFRHRLEQATGRHVWIELHWLFESAVAESRIVWMCSLGFYELPGTIRRILKVIPVMILLLKKVVIKDLKIPSCQFSFASAFDFSCIFSSFSRSYFFMSILFRSFNSWSCKSTVSISHRVCLSCASNSTSVLFFVDLRIDGDTATVSWLIVEILSSSW